MNKALDALTKLDVRKQKLLLQEKALKEKERKQRFKRHQEIGELVGQIGLGELENDVLIGALIEIAKDKSNEDKKASWKKLGLDFNKKPNDDLTKFPLVIVFDNDVSKDKNITGILKDLQFKWNRFRKEYYGYGDKNIIEKMLSGYVCTISEVVGE